MYVTTGVSPACGQVFLSDWEHTSQLTNGVESAYEPELGLIAWQASGITADQRPAVGDGRSSRRRYLVKLLLLNRPVASGRDGLAPDDDHH
jgi:hypothetical protein